MLETLYEIPKLFIYADDQKFKDEAHKYLVNVFQSSTYDPEIVRKLASMEEKALNEVLGKLQKDERKVFLEALDSALLTEMSMSESYLMRPMQSV